MTHLHNIKHMFEPHARRTQQVQGCSPQIINLLLNTLICCANLSLCVQTGTVVAACASPVVARWSAPTTQTAGRACAQTDAAWPLPPATTAYWMQEKDVSARLFNGCRYRCAVVTVCILVVKCTLLWPKAHRAQVQKLWNCPQSV